MESIINPKELTMPKVCHKAQCSIFKVSSIPLADHVFEAQTLSRLMRLVNKKKLLEDLFLGNYKQGFFLQPNADKINKAPDFKDNTYLGSLYRRPIAEPRGPDHMNRLALLDSTANNRKICGKCTNQRR
jgi:hypothetical protein